MGLLRIVLLFGSGVIALALIVVPIADRHARQPVAVADLPAGLDMTSTGSVTHAGRYTLRRSVLQSTPGAVCVIRADGARSGGCD